jgi:hypothetical protein
MNPQIDAAFHNITDTFTGLDGGVAFVKLRALINKLSKDADAGDEAAKDILLFVTRFSKLIDVASSK